MSIDKLDFIFFITTAFFVFMAGFIIYFVLMYQKRQVQNKLEKENLEAKFRQEFLKTRIEVQEQTFNYVSREIHDNVTQVLSFIKLNMAMIGTTDEEQRTKINENRELIAQVITDLRDLSKSLSYQHIANSGLVSTIDNEVKKINKSGILQAELIVEGEKYPLGEQRELVLFRIFQESLNNILKHADAGNLKIGVYYIPEMFNLTVEDDGIGFSANSLSNSGGSGLVNIENRAALIGARASVESSPGKGCKITVSLNPLKNRLNEDGTYSNSIS